MQRLSISFLLLFFLAPTAWSQTDTAVQGQRAKIQFSSYTSAGVMMGQNNPQLMLQTVNGVQYKDWFLGAGVGLDYYYFRTLPVFVDVRRLVIPKKHLYLYADAGVNFPMIHQPEIDNWYKNEYQSGIYLDAGAGYLFTMSKQTGFFSIGYSTKRVRETVEHPYIWGPPNVPVHKDRIKYNFNRIAVKVGIRL